MLDLVNFNVKASLAAGRHGTLVRPDARHRSEGLRATATAHREATQHGPVREAGGDPGHLGQQGAPERRRQERRGGAETEDLNGNHIWDYTDANSNGKWDEGEAEPWTYDPLLGDNYSATVGYGSGYRNPYGSGTEVKTNDYGRQMMLTTFSPKDASVSSMYYSWGHTTDQTNADSIAAAIRGERCEDAALDTNYAAANGGKIGPIQAAWGDLIGQDASAHWDDASNTVLGSSYGANWQTESPRTWWSLYNPSAYANTPNANTLQFINLAKVWIDQRPCWASGHLQGADHRTVPGIRERWRGHGRPGRHAGVPPRPHQVMEALVS